MCYANAKLHARWDHFNDSGGHFVKIISKITTGMAQLSVKCLGQVAVWLGLNSLGGNVSWVFKGF